jgi:hypothetical protein
LRELSATQVFRRVHATDRGGVIVDVVIVEVAGQLRGLLLLDAPLETAPGGIAELLPTLLRGVELLREPIEIDFAGCFEDGFLFVFVELFRFGLLVHRGKRRGLQMRAL